MIVSRNQLAVRARARANSGSGRGSKEYQWLMASGLCCLVAFGCSATNERQEFEWAISVEPQTTVAVAPAMNFSGSSDFDVVKVSDAMASELSSLPGIGVIGVSRVLAVLAEQGIGQIQSPEHALEICDRLGADAIIVFAVTEYNAYTPVVGIVAQLYGKRQAAPAMDPVATSRMAKPFPVPPSQDAHRPWAQVQRTFNAEHESTRRQVQGYAQSRSAGQSPYQWRKYLASQVEFLRFCCFSIAQELMHQQI